MDILLLHLSDLHFKEKDNFDTVNIDSIVSALQQSMYNIEHILIIISGDLTFSGTKKQYEQIQNFLNLIKDKIIKRYKVEDIQFVLVPGNHDNNYKICHLTRSNLETIAKEDKYDNYVEKEIEKLRQFYKLAKQFDCFPNGELVYKKTIIYGDKKIQFNLINTAIFSSLEEDQGFHYLPDSSIEMLKDQGDSDFVMTVMHHPHHWYSSKCKKRLEQSLYSRSDLLYVGHEHYVSTMEIENQGTSVDIFSGGKLCDSGNWEGSEFHVAILNLATRNYRTKTYRLDSLAEIYKVVGNNELYLGKNRFNQLNLTVKPEFMTELVKDKNLISGSSLDYFVFPLLIQKEFVDVQGKLPLEIDSFTSLNKIIESKGKIVIFGARDTGKSMVAKAVFKELAINKVALFINGNDVTNNFERTIRNAFEDIYTSDNVTLEAFMQMAPSQRCIIIDDIDRVKPSLRNYFSDYLNQNFGVVFVTRQPYPEIDIKNILKTSILGHDYLYFNIEPFYKNKRRELVSNIVHLLMKFKDEEERQQIISLVSDVLTKQKYLYSLSPEFIVQFTRYYCNNIGDNRQSDATVFSIVFEAKIVELLKPFAKKFSVDRLLTILDKIAFEIFVHKLYPVSGSDLSKIIDKYNNDYGVINNPIDLINIFKDSRIITEVKDGYLFYDRNYLSYFVARELRRKCIDDNDFEQFKWILKYSYIGINADILLFLTYISDNENIIKLILKQGEETVQKWKEFTFENLEIPFFVKPVELIIKPLEDGEIENEENLQATFEKEEMHGSILLNDASIFNGESEVLSFIQEILRSISLMSIIARILPAFEHRMKKEEKTRCVNLIYQMPLKIFWAWVNEIDNYSSELIEEIKNYHEWDYQKRNLSTPQMADKDALILLRRVVIAVLLDLMNLAMHNATRENTNDFIDGFNFKLLSSYGVEHLMGLEYRDNVQEFCKESERLLNEKHWLTSYMVKQVMRHLLVNSKNLKSADLQKLSARIFEKKLPQNKPLQNRLLIEKNRNKDKR